MAKYRKNGKAHERIQLGAGVKALMERSSSKPVETLTLDDVRSYRVWEFVECDELLETYVGPVIELPVLHLDGRLASCELRLANGDMCWGLLGNIDSSDAQQTEDFLTLGVFRGDGCSFNLARYFDSDAIKSGPDALAQFLSLPRNSVFPIHYDIRDVACGDAKALEGDILSEPRRRLSRAERIAAAAPRKR